MIKMFNPGTICFILYVDYTYYIINRLLSNKVIVEKIL